MQWIVTDTYQALTYCIRSVFKLLSLITGVSCACLLAKYLISSVATHDHSLTFGVPLSKPKMTTTSKQQKANQHKGCYISVNFALIIAVAVADSDPKHILWLVSYLAWSHMIIHNIKGWANWQCLHSFLG